MIDTLKSICDQCAHLHNPQLEFISEKSERERQIILRDLRELVSAASLEHEKSVIVLGGGLFESILYCFISAQGDEISLRRGETFTVNPDHSLDNYVRIFNRYFSTLLEIPDIIVAYRNMVHINRELKYPPDTCRSAAGDILRFLNMLLGKLMEYAKN